MRDQQEIISGDSQPHIFKKGGDTGDIISAVMSADTVGTLQVEDFAQTIEGEDVPTTCYNLYNWVRNSIPYVEDKGLQAIQLPGEVYNNRYPYILDSNGNGGTGKGADCKSMSLFCSCVLRCLNNYYDFNYRFISENANSPVHHVYLIVNYTDAEGNAWEIPLDCTLPEFGVEVNYVHKIDKAPTVPVETARVGEFNLFKIGALTVEELEKGLWEPDIDLLKSNFDAMVKKSKYDIRQSVFNAYKSHPIKESEIQKFFIQHYEDVLGFASAGLYHYWNDNTHLPYFACQRDSVNHQDIPLPPAYIVKKQTADDIVSAFQKLGLRDFDIYYLINLGTYRKYGTSADYMLYRCYCIELYGQPFKPHPNVPYWDNQQGILMNNGGNFQDTLGIALCFPAQGGIGRPFGQPYWSMGGWIINNGASDAEVKQFEKDNARPGTPIEGDQQNLVPGNIVNNGAGISLESQQQALVIYNRWAKGNMVCLPQPEANLGKLHVSGIGYAAGELVGIVVAVISAVIAVVTLVAKLVDMFKHPPDASKIALPTQDFKWDYQTADGCMIGHCVALGGCNGAQTVKMCGGKIVEVNPNPADPKNQPPDPGNFFGGPLTGNRKTEVLAAAALMIGGGLMLKE